MRLNHRVARSFLAFALCVSLVASQRTIPARATISGTTWTCIILCGGALAYYLTKLSIDNKKADAQGNAVDAIINNNWIPDREGLEPAGVGTPNTSLRYLRAKIINAAYDKFSKQQDQNKNLRAEFENFRTCWNSFVYAGPPKSAPSSQPTAAATNSPPTSAPGKKQDEHKKEQGGGKPGKTPSPKKSPSAVALAPLDLPHMVAFDGSGTDGKTGSAHAKPTHSPKPKPTHPPKPKPTASPTTAPASTPTPTASSQSGCTTNAYAIIDSFDGNPTPSYPQLDVTDLESAFSTGASLYDQVVNLNVGSSEDVDDLRAQYLVYVGTKLLGDLTGHATAAQAGTKSVDLSSVLSSCGVTGVNTISCITTLGAVESTYAADRRKDVACDVAMRAQIPMLTTIRRVLTRLASHPVTQGGGTYSSFDVTEKITPLTTTPPPGTGTQTYIEAPLEGPSFNFGAVPGC